MSKPVHEMTREELDAWVLAKFEEALRRNGIAHHVPTDAELTMLRFEAERMLAEIEASMRATIPGYGGTLQ